MSSSLHNALVGAELHTPFRQVFANAAARLADATVYTAADLYKGALQIDTAQTFFLSSFSPTVWSAAAGTGEANTGSNVGSGAGVFQSKVGVDLRFKSLVAGSNVAITPFADELVISAGGGGEVNTASNVGAGSGWFRSKVLADLTFKSITAGTNITLGVGADDITVNTTAEANTASNVGAGSGVFRSKTGVDLAFKSLIAGTAITVTPGANDITLATTAEANTASNLGAGAQSFKAKVGVDLQFRSVVAGTLITATQNANDITIATTAEINTASNVGAGSGVFKAKTASDLAFKSIIGGTGVTVTANADDLTLSVVAPKSAIHWGNSGVAATTTTRYLTPGYEDSTAPTTVIQWRVPFAGTISLLRVRQNTGAGNGNAIVYTLRKNGAAQTLTVSMASTANDGSDLANSVTVAAGDLVDIEVTKAASVAATPSDIVASAQYAPT